MFQLAKPRGKIANRQKRKNRSAGQPHDQSRQLLVLQRRESPRNDKRRIVRVPGLRRKGHERAQGCTLQTGCEKKGNCHPIACELRRSLLDLRRVNRWFGGRRLLLEALEIEVRRCGQLLRAHT